MEVTLETARKTEAEIDELKRQWKSDPCWDIEETEGFEAHKQELHIFRLGYELRQERDENFRIKKALKVIFSAVNP